MTISVQEVLDFVKELVEPEDADFIVEALHHGPSAADGTCDAYDLNIALSPASWLIWLRLAHGEAIAKPAIEMPKLPEPDELEHRQPSVPYVAPQPIQPWRAEPRLGGFEVWC